MFNQILLVPEVERDVRKLEDNSEIFELISLMDFWLHLDLSGFDMT